MEKAGKKIWLSKSFIILICFFAVIVTMYVYDKNLLPVWNVSLKPGVYQCVDKESGQIVVSEDCNIRFCEFDLNSEVKGTYYTEDLNAIFLNQNRKFSLHKGITGCYLLTNKIQNEEMQTLQIEYYPREDKLVLLTATEGKTFTFQMK